MKKNAKNRVISQIETTVRRVTLLHCESESPFLYVVLDYSKTHHAIVSSKYFMSIREAENYLFEQYVYMIIPSDRLIHEGFHVFLY